MRILCLTHSSMPWRFLHPPTLHAGCQSTRVSIAVPVTVSPWQGSARAHGAQHILSHAWRGAEGLAHWLGWPHLVVWDPDELFWGDLMA